MRVCGPSDAKFSLRVPREREVEPETLMFATGSLLGNRLISACLSFLMMTCELPMVTRLFFQLEKQMKEIKKIQGHTVSKTG